MKYTVDILINLPQARAVELFSDTSNYQRWQPGLLTCEPIEGEPGTDGATTRLVHKMGRREIEMVETVVKNELPSTQTLTYTAKGVWNEVINDFVAVGEDQTRLSIQSEFRCKGVMRVMTKLMPGMFKKATAKHLQSFKEFAEAQTTGA